MKSFKILSIFLAALVLLGCMAVPAAAVSEPQITAPTALVLDPADPRSGWDPTDPDPENPWLQDWQLTAKEATP